MHLVLELTSEIFKREASVKAYYLAFLKGPHYAALVSLSAVVQTVQLNTLVVKVMDSWGNLATGLQLDHPEASTDPCCSCCCCG